MLLAMKSNLANFLGCSLDRVSVIMRPAFENVRSQGTDVATRLSLFKIYECNIGYTGLRLPPDQWIFKAT